MDTNSEVMLSTADVAKRLKVGSAMVRKWAIAYEGATGDKVKLRSKRDGREFSGSQVAVISAAKKLVDSEGVKVETALKMVLGQAELVPVALSPSAEDSDSLEALKEFLARTDETNQLLLQEIRGLRQDFRELPSLAAEKNTLESGAAAQDGDSSKKHRVLVRLALKIESWLKLE
jgi:hypothetical protein